LRDLELQSCAQNGGSHVSLSLSLSLEEEEEEEEEEASYDWCFRLILIPLFV